MMRRALRFSLAAGALTALAASADAQVPDLLNALDAGGRSMGMGGSLHATASDTLASYYNPASLGFIDAPQVGIAYRNLPSSRSDVTGSRSDPNYDSDGKSGRSAVSHLGFAYPLGRFGPNLRGTLAFSFTLGGYMKDRATGPVNGLTDGPLTITDYRLNREAESDFYTLAYGIANRSQTAAFGVGLIYARQRIAYSESGSAVDSSGTAVPFDGLDAKSNGNGFGLLVGGQFVPRSARNVSLGLSYRSEINLNGNRETRSLYDKIPARLLGGVSYRKDGIRRGQDYLVLGAQFQQFFATSSSFAFDRNAQTTFSLGGEYNLSAFDARIPLRLGYQLVPGAGDTFGRRNAYTYGIGYYSNKIPVGLDLNWAVPDHGGYDFGISASYRFK